MIYDSTAKSILLYEVNNGAHILIVQLNTWNADNKDLTWLDEDNSLFYISSIK